ncbi:MAG: AraC family transcriptional regulator, partial [Oscillospiraceae bacterium]|nr:AraC family transcriptional regulator [Oscillospiraceae bacterium]
VISLNGQPVDFEGQMIPLSLRVGAVPLSISRSVRYSELFDRMQHAINEPRDVGKVIYFLDD